MVKGYVPENGRKHVERVADAHSILKPAPTTLSSPQIVPQSILRPVRTGGCGGCGGARVI
jgi:hypothetical protein